MPDEEEYKVTKRSGRGLAGAFVLILSLLPLPLLLAAAASQSPWFVRNDPSWVEQLSAPRYEIKLEYDVKIPMRDGVLLSADIWRPRAEGKFPVILMHMPYNNNQKSDYFMADMVGHAQYFVPRGFVFVATDTRGRYDSDGQSYIYWHRNWREGRFDGQDVDDCLSWLAQQPWPTGKIAMSGGSSLGFVQWLVAALGNPHLVAIVPYVSPDDHHDNVFPHGAFQLSSMLHFFSVMYGRTVKSTLIAHFWDWERLYRHLPLRTLDEALLGKRDQLWQDFMDHPFSDEYWRFSVGHRPGPGQMSPGKYPRVNVPSLNVTGWYDVVQQATINNYLGMVRFGPEAIRDNHHLIVGPWGHLVGPRRVGDLDFGPQADIDFRPIELRWYDYWLKGVDNGIMDEPPVNIFVMGEDKWRSEPGWPLDRAEGTKVYFRRSGRANSRFGDGRLSSSTPAQEPPDSFVYDPEDPVPTYGGNVSMQPRTSGPRDQRAIQRRDDVLVYTGPVLEEDVEVTGRVLATLYAATTAPDTDFTAKLVDVHPNGYARILTEGIVRGRYRNSFEKEEFITPGEVLESTIDLWSVSHVFQKGHRIQLEISSSNFPKYDRNPNTGHKFAEDSELRKATQTIYHDSRYPSHVVLPVVPPKYSLS